MDAITATATTHGLSLLNSELKNTATKYSLIGATTHDAADADIAAFYTATIDSSFYDDNGVLTFVVELPIATDFEKYLYRVVITDANNVAVIDTPTPKVALAAGIGGMMTIKAAITGDAGTVVFKSSDFVTTQEMNDIWLPPVAPKGSVISFAASSPPNGWLECNGAELSRTAYAALFAVIGTTFGAGDGNTTFNLPDLRGEFIRGFDNGRSVDIGRVLGSSQMHLIKIPDGVMLRAAKFSASDGAVDHVGTSHIVGAYDMNAAPYGNSSITYHETRPRNIAMLFCIKY